MQRMLWVDVQRMQILPYEQEPNVGIPYIKLCAFLDNGNYIQEEILQFESYHMIPEIHYYTEDQQFIATLKVVSDNSTQSGWKSILIIQ